MLNWPINRFTYLSVHPITQTAADRKSRAVFTIFLKVFSSIIPPRQPPKQYFIIKTNKVVRILF